MYWSHILHQPKPNFKSWSWCLIFDKCHHNNIYGKINIRVVPFLPIFVREVCEYKKANIENIKKEVSNFDWNKAFDNLSINEKVELLNETLLNIFRNYISNKKK